jgi:hypothetical protein
MNFFICSPARVKRTPPDNQAVGPWVGIHCFRLAKLGL